MRYTTNFDCGFFGLRITTSDLCLLEIAFIEDGFAPTRKLPDVPQIMHTVHTQLHDWLDDPFYCFDLPLFSGGTPFRQRVWSEIRRIPAGEVQTYGAIAKLLGSSARAVGQACGDNPVPVVIPCHRVLGARGAGGFNHSAAAKTLAIKQWLLQREGVNI